MTSKIIFQSAGDAFPVQDLQSFVALLRDAGATTARPFVDYSAGGVAALEAEIPEAWGQAPANEKGAEA